MRILGIDGGIASVGWAVIDIGETDGTIRDAGVWCFDAPETDKEKTPSNSIRRQKRGQRRVTRRRAQRMAALRRLFAADGLLPDSRPDALHHKGFDPWHLRAEGLERRLGPAELAVALGHIARHRGFRSNSKRERGANAPKETSEMLTAIAATSEQLSRYATVGQMFARDERFRERKHNREGDYTRSVQRTDLEREADALFAAQRRLGNPAATETLQARFADIAFSQRPLQDSEHLLRPCPFEPGRKRTARRSYAFELFRLLSRLANLRLTSGGREWKLSVEQIGQIAADFGRTKKLTYRSIRKTLDLAPQTRFAGIGADAEAQDAVARSGNAAEGTATLRDVVGPSAWAALLHAPETLDRIYEVLNFRDSPDSIRDGLAEAGVKEPVLATIMSGVSEGRFAAFSGAGHISAKAARRIIPHLARGLVYSEACAEAGYDHTARAQLGIGDIMSGEGHRRLAAALDEQVRNPVARKAVSEMLKQVRAIIREFGLPDRIHVELARDVGKSAEERQKITNGIERRNVERDRARRRFAELLGREPSGSEEMLRFELWEEQNGRCLYTDEAISPGALVATDNSVQVDHILPWSRFGDDSFMNKTLCFASANQAKRGRTPFEWFSAERTEQEWASFSSRVENCRQMKGYKKRGHYLRRNATEVEEAFRSRNLNDTRYACRLLLEILAGLFPDDGQRHVFARPGGLTARLRRAWGVEALKKGPDGKRLEDDRHHALDAIVLAATSESMLQALTRASQESERMGLPRGMLFREVPEPWAGFREAAAAAVGKVFVARAERHRARGEAHAATIRQVRERNGRTVVYERKPVQALKPADLDRLKDPERNAALRASLQAWIDAGKPKGALPRSPKGDEIRKVRLETDGKVSVQVRGGTADRGDMARVDVFAKPDARGRMRYYLVPIYPHQIFDRQRFPAAPNRAVIAYEPEENWTVIDSTYQFCFSLFHNSIVDVAKSGGEAIFGYFKGLHRGTGAINIAAHKSQHAVTAGIGAKTLSRFRKQTVDRIGRLSFVGQEVRTWRGEVCT